MKSKAFRAALPYTIPICIGFLFLGISYGFFMHSKGFSFLYPVLMSLFIFAGSMEFVTVNLLLTAFNPLSAFLLALMVNARHLFMVFPCWINIKTPALKSPILFMACVTNLFP